ncbi:hypothetical protein, partial [Bacteroides heparinolyticus]|uniref:hypothetical protein n=3 Tax=Prevotella heparinolytica TaxID=28113 RepID=UPI0035A10592
SPTDYTPAGSTSDRGKRGDQKEKGKEIRTVKRFTNRNKNEGRRADIFSKESVLLKEKGNKYRFAKLKKENPQLSQLRQWRAT